jgi:poly(3-hydroxybutyrate) depolymerase
MTVVIRWFAWIIVPVAVAVALPVTLSSASGDYYHQMTMDDGTRMEFRLLAPELKLSSYPFLLALTQGAQTRDEVDWEWRNLYRDQTERRVWVVVSPVAPTGHSFHRGGYKYIPELLRRLSERYRPEGGKYYLAGVSNGGLAAFSLAFEHPELFHAMAVFPGWPSRRLLAGLDRLAELPIKICAGLCQEDAQASCCTRDEGGPFGAGLQEQASNSRKLLQSKAAVVNVTVKRRDSITSCGG